MSRVGERKIMLVLLDGLADRAYQNLGDMTPLEAAETPHLDALAAAGSTGFMYPLAPGLCPSSYQAHFALFGYPLERFPGRGLLEAIGEGCPPASGEVVMRASMLLAQVVDGTFHVTARPDPRKGSDVFSALDLNMRLGDVDVRFVPTGTLQGLVYFSSARPLSHEVTDADPFGSGLPVVSVQPFAEAVASEAARRTAAAANEWMVRCRRIVCESVSAAILHGVPDHTGALQDAKAGGEPMVVTKWAGALTDIQPFEKRFGLRGATVASGPLYGGVGLILGMDHHDPGTLDGRATEDLAQRLELGLRLLDEGYSFVHVHSKVPDDAGHRKDPAHKRDRIAELDLALAPLVESLSQWRDSMVVAVTADHATPSAGPLYHSGEAVPLAVVGGTGRRDEVQRFGEKWCRHGILGQLRGTDLMPVLLNAADRSRFLAERFTPDERFGALAPSDLAPLRADVAT